MLLCRMDFKRIKAYQRARALGVAVNKLAAKFPRRFEHLRAQLVRSVDSIGANIAEGAPSESKREFARFLQHSIRSSSETEHHLLEALDHQLLPSAVWKAYSTETIEVRKMIIGYRKRVIATAEEEERLRVPAPRPRRKAP